MGQINTFFYTNPNSLTADIRTAMSFDLTCYLPAEDLIFFTINIELDAWAAELPEAIAKELKEVGWGDINPRGLPR